MGYGLTAESPYSEFTTTTSPSLLSLLLASSYAVSHHPQSKTTNDFFPSPITSHYSLLFCSLFTTSLNYTNFQPIIIIIPSVHPPLGHLHRPTYTEEPLAIPHSPSLKNHFFFNYNEPQ